MCSAPPILTCEEARQLEDGLFGGDSAKEWAAMQAAGRAIATRLRSDFLETGPWPKKPRVLVLAGKGHNGGDALLAADELLRLSPEARVEVVLLVKPVEMKPNAERALRQLQERGRERVQPVAGEWSQPDVILDGFFGFSYRPHLTSVASTYLRRANAMPAGLKVAVDVPSGIGEPDGFRADFCYATGSVKDVVVAPGALAWTGRVRYLDLGFFNALHPTASCVLTHSTLAPLRALRRVSTDKRQQGHVLILAGSGSYPGAAMMAVRAALNAGVGLVTAFVPETLVPAFAAAVPEAIWIGCPVTPEGGIALEASHLFRQHGQRGTAWLIGPGLGRERETLALVADVLRTSEMPVVLDADALQSDLVCIGRCPKVVTPHAGEWERIRNGLTPGDFCALNHAVVAEKGPHTWVHGRERSFFSPAGGPVLARGGSGDLLSGMVAARVAIQPEERLRATCEAVLWHGLAADALARDRGQVAVRTTELLDYLPRALREEIHDE